MQVGVKKDGETESEFLITGSRGISMSVLNPRPVDKTLIIWSIEPKAQHDEDKRWGYPRKVLKGKF